MAQDDPLPAQLQTAAPQLSCTTSFASTCTSCVWASATPATTAAAAATTTTTTITTATSITTTTTTIAGITSLRQLMPAQDLRTPGCQAAGGHAEGSGHS